MLPTYDNAPRPITEDEARALAHAEYEIRSSNGQHLAYSRGADGGMHLRETFSRSQACVAWVNARSADLRERILAGKCTHTVFYDRARDAYYLG